MSRSTSNLLSPLLDHFNKFLKMRFSLSLSRREQSKFEEEFKYLVVTSSLFNDSLKPATTTASVLNQSPAFLNDDIGSEPLASQKRDNLSTNDPTIQNILITSSINVIVSSIFLTKFDTSSTMLLLLPVYTILCYFTYRYQKHTQIRKLHSCAINTINELIAISQDSDQLLYRLINLSHYADEEEGGGKRAQELTKSLGSLLSNHLQSYMGMIKSLEPLVDKRNMTRFRDMYNIKEKIPSQLIVNDSDEDAFKLEDIDLLITMITWKRREYLLHLLALDVLSAENMKKEQQHITSTTYYSQSWIKAIQANRQLIDEYTAFNSASTQLFYKNTTSVSSEDDNSSMQSSSVINELSIRKKKSIISTTDGMTTSSFDGRALALMHRISAIEKLMEDMQASLFLCKQDTRLVSGNSTNSNCSSSNRRFSSSAQYHLVDRLNRRFEHLDREIKNLCHQWEESKQSLNYLLSLEDKKELLPSPPASPNLYFFKHQNKYLTSDLATSPITTTTHFKSIGLRRSHTYSGERPSSLHQHRKLQNIRFNNLPIFDTKVQDTMDNNNNNDTSTINIIEPNTLK
ncbi:hypothetical protein BDF20DRAFT_1000386 [Mycotypha africana]|uniref:uncharacterized protein n=1 Tax=Mycotypha africana TaxID=64632 RepID=UPI002300D6F5|nr:uncharacterized protein BDF20DRAFT_1000386 [Mycotypha africana]KAI8982431.1 hypothetical protein BDF20DRAFT_1000386 [Mycotypha africana]